MNISIANLSVYLCCAVSSSHTRGKTVIEPPRWKINIMNENSGAGDNTRHNSMVSSRRKLSDTTAAMEVTEDSSDMRTLKMPSQQKFNVPSVQLNKIQFSVQDISGPSVADLQPSSSSPTPFQSLESTGEHFMHYNMQVLHPSINNLSFTGFKEPERPGFPGK